VLVFIDTWLRDSGRDTWLVDGNKVRKEGGSRLLSPMDKELDLLFLAPRREVISPVGANVKT
jgi:hypothetical protein